jgi:hypothetical protein
MDLFASDHLTTNTQAAPLAAPSSPTAPNTPNCLT